MASAKIPIVNYVDGAPLGDYAGVIELGADRRPAWVILDTGSSTLAVWEDKFEGVETRPAGFVQFVGYGTGHWAGPVLEAQVGMGTGEHYIGLERALVSQIQSGQYQGRRQFAPADGILGLAYYQLNDAAATGDRSVPINQYDSQAKWQRLVGPGGLRMEYLPPFFSEIVEAGGTPNKLALLTRRSIPHAGSDPASDPLNQGWLILGGGEEHSELYTGELQAVREIDDPQGVGRYYNSNLLSVRVGDDEPIEVSPPQNPNLLSNSIIDSGTNSLALAPGLLQAIESALGNRQRPSSAADLEGWPTIFFTLEGVGGAEVTLEVPPENYWQLDSVTGSRTGGTITGSFPAFGSSGSEQSILGLPLLNGHYVVFDRSSSDPPVAGQIKFAKAAPGA